MKKRNRKNNKNVVKGRVSHCLTTPIPIPLPSSPFPFKIKSYTLPNFEGREYLTPCSKPPSQMIALDDGVGEISKKGIHRCIRE